MGTIVKGTGSPWVGDLTVVKGAVRLVLVQAGDRGVLGRGDVFFSSFI